MQVVSDGMILQSAPKQSMVWGFCSNTTTNVAVTFNGTAIAATIGPDQALGKMTTWRVLLPAAPPSFEEHSLTATATEAGGGAKTTLTLSNFMFGDIWVCSGQCLYDDVTREPRGFGNRPNVFCRVALVTPDRRTV